MTAKYKRARLTSPEFNDTMIPFILLKASPKNTIPKATSLKEFLFMAIKFTQYLQLRYT